MTLLERVGDWLAANARAVRDSPPLTGLVAGVWMFLLVLATGGNPVLAFLTVAPIVMLAAYAVDWILGYLRDDDESVATNSGTRDDAPAYEYEPADEEAAIERLRERYAAGAVGHDEFERRLDALLETETLTPDREGGRSGRTARGRTRSPSRSLERNETSR